MALGNAKPVRSTLACLKVQGVWTGGGAAADCTKAAADLSRGIASIAYNAATGKYLITFTDVGTQIIGGSVEIMGAAGGAPKQANICRATFSASAKTVQVEIWDLATPSLIALATTDKVCVRVEFSPVGVDS